MSMRIKNRVLVLSTVFLAIFIFSGCDNNQEKTDKKLPISTQNYVNQQPTINNATDVENNAEVKINSEKNTTTAKSTSCGEDYYKNVDGNCVHRPSDNPSGASAKCRDGSYSYSQHRQGTCSGHGGVAQWL